MPKKNRKPSQAKGFAAIEHISIMGAVGRMGPIGLWMYAQAYAKVADSLPSPITGFEPVRYHLVCHSIELSLKSLLSLNDATMIELAESPYGHNLQSLLQAAKEKGLNKRTSLSRDQEREITKAATYHGGKLFSYPAVGEALRGYPELPDMNILLQAANLLVSELERPCKEIP